jgi:hypothetical protein
MSLGSGLGSWPICERPQKTVYTKSAFHLIYFPSKEKAEEEEMNKKEKQKKRDNNKKKTRKVVKREEKRKKKEERKSQNVLGYLANDRSPYFFDTPTAPNPA